MRIQPHLPHRTTTSSVRPEGRRTGVCRGSEVSEWVGERMSQRIAPGGPGKGVSLCVCRYRMPPFC